MKSTLVLNKNAVAQILAGKDLGCLNALCTGDPHVGDEEKWFVGISS